MYNNYPYNSYNPYIAQPQPQPMFPFPFPPRTQRVTIDSGSALKNRRGKIRIDFNRTFSRPPVVVVSPFWRSQNSQVSFVDTIDSISRTGFTVVSDNTADNYFVNWVAVLVE